MRTVHLAAALAMAVSASNAFAPAPLSQLGLGLRGGSNAHSTRRMAVSTPVSELELTATDEEIDREIDATIGFGPGTAIIRKYKPGRTWLWRRWRGTVFEATWKTAFFNTCVSAALTVCLGRVTGTPFGTTVVASHPVVQKLAGLDKVWHYQMTLTTFILTFFLGQAFAMWKTAYSIGRKIQGRLNDVSLLLATHGARDATGAYTPAARVTIDSCAHYMRLFHVLLWGGACRRLRPLLTNRGYARMVARGVMTQQECDTLQSLDLPATQRHNAVVEWVVVKFREARKTGALEGGDGFEQLFLDKVCTLRGTYATIGDEMDGRMPLAYAHFVQILVDTFLIVAPFALYPELGSLGIAATGVLTLFYQGLLDLAKIFLDPYDNEDYGADSDAIDVAVLIGESNAGSVRWSNGLDALPPDLACLM